MLHRKGRVGLGSFLLITFFVSATPDFSNAFDSFWHSSAAAEVGRVYGFSEGAVKALQFSSFCMDYFGPFVTEVVGTVEKSVSYLELRNLPSTGRTHAASNFMHFDNLAAALDQNWKFDYLWARLLDNVRHAVTSYYTNTTMKEDDRKMLILLSLGSSLHMVEDFYSHSDWVHFNFTQLGFPAEKTKDGYDRAPTWFEVRQKFGVPSFQNVMDNWKFRVCSGVFPPSDKVPSTTLGVPLSHTQMNHDNSQLYYNGASQITYHAFGAYPAIDSASAVTHQLYAYHTACAAALEWVALIEEDPQAKQAIEYAKGWDVTKLNRHAKDDLEDAMSTVLMLSCMMQKWDGNHPPPERDKECATTKIAGHMHIPKMSNVFWAAFPKDSILEKLSFGFGDSTGHYTFDSLWLQTKK